MLASAEDVRRKFVDLLQNEQFVTDKTGVKTIEIVGASFLADERAVFGTVNDDYVKREIRWYEMMSLNVNDIPGGAPAAWKRCAGKNGEINSNYGNLVWSVSNFSQLDHVIEELKKNPLSRRAIAIYTRPSMWLEYDKHGMSDFCCTNACQYFIRDGKLDVVVQMRSNDVWSGYRNDRAWQVHLQEIVAAELGANVGRIVWQVGSLHCYEQQFYLVDHFAKTGEKTITRERYREVYGK